MKGLPAVNGSGTKFWFPIGAVVTMIVALMTIGYSTYSSLEERKANRAELLKSEQQLKEELHAADARNNKVVEELKGTLNAMDVRQRDVKTAVDEIRTILKVLMRERVLTMEPSP